MLAEIIGGSPRLLQAADHTEVVLPHIMGKVA